MWPWNESVPPVAEAEKIRRTKAERQILVLKTAARLFREKGFHDCGIATIAEHSGVHVAQIYRDFPGKEGVVEALVRSGLGRTTAAIEDALHGGDVRANLHRWVCSTMEAARECNPGGLILEIFAEATHNPAVAAILRQEEAVARRSLVAALEQCFGATRPREDLEGLAELLLAVNFGFYIRLALVPPASPENVTQLVEQSLLTLLQPPAPPGSPPAEP